MFCEALQSVHIFFSSGWYVGRAVHIHIKLYYGMNTTTAHYTGQLYFDEETIETVSSVSPYSSSNITRILNTNDGIYNSGQGAQTTLQVTGSVMAGYTAATFTIGIELPEDSEYVYFIYRIRCRRNQHHYCL